MKKSASPVFRKALATGDATALQKYLVKKFARPRRKLNRFFDSPVAFAARNHASLRDPAEDSELPELVATIDAAKSKADVRAVCRQLTAQLTDPARCPDALTLLTAAEFVVRHPAAFSATDLQRVYHRLATWKHAEELPRTGAALTLQRLIAGELLFVLSLLLNPLRCAKALRTDALDCLAECLEESTDTDGTLSADLLPDLSQWLSSFVRVNAWATAFHESWARKATLKRWRDTVSWLATLTVPHGFLTSASDTAATDLGLLSEAVALTEFEEDSEVPRLMKRLGKWDNPPFIPRARASKALTVPACGQSDWATVAVLRSHLKADADVCTLDWHTLGHRLNFAVQGRRLFQGHWSRQVTVAGKPVPEPEDWACSCWFYDNEVAFVELEALAPDGTRHVRHVMLSLNQHLAILTDTVTCDDHADVTLESRLPLSNNATVDADQVTRELLLGIDNVVVRAVPAWLEDDRVLHALGDCRVDDQQLILQSRGRSGVTQPLILDWHPDRHRFDADWNRLTVTEERAPQSPGQASGFRVRIGPLQLLLYRSLRVGQSLRAVLGYHTGCETMYGCINTKGRIDPLVVVESNEEPASTAP